MKGLAIRLITCLVVTIVAIAFTECRSEAEEGNGTFSILGGWHMNGIGPGAGLAIGAKNQFDIEWIYTPNIFNTDADNIKEFSFHAVNLKFFLNENIFAGIGAMFGNIETKTGPVSTKKDKSNGYTAFLGARGGSSVFIEGRAGYTKVKEVTGTDGYSWQDSDFSGPYISVGVGVMF